MASRGAVGRASAAIVAALLMFAGCAVVLDASSDLGPHCRFEGDEDTTCGACVASSCQAVVDACCSDEVCAGDLGALDDCTQGDAIACLDLEIDIPALGDCVQAHCENACDPFGSGEGGNGTGGAGSGGGPPGLIPVCTQDELSCVCHAEEDTGQTPTICSTGQFQGCCAVPGYPAADLACGCFVGECVDYGTFCECGYFDADASDSTSCSPLYPICCFDPVELTCLCEEEGQCEENETLVESCSAYDLGCGSESLEVDDCDF